MAVSAPVVGVREFLLAFADDEHLMGQQHTEWIGVAPFLEEDLAFSSIGQDELGHAAMLYELVLEIDGITPDDAALDTLAYGRPSADYRSCHLVEHTTGDWAEALVRHWIYDTFEEMRWQLVADSSLTKLAAVARRALREEAYHRRHADALLDKLLPSPDARQRILRALDAVAPLVEGLCEPVEGEAEAIRQGVSAGSTADLAGPLSRAIAERVARPGQGAADLGQGAANGETESGQRTGGSRDGGRNLQLRRTQRSPDFGPLMRRMREVLDYDPEAVW